MEIVTSRSADSINDGYAGSVSKNPNERNNIIRMFLRGAFNRGSSRPEVERGRQMLERLALRISAMIPTTGIITFDNDGRHHDEVVA